MARLGIHTSVHYAEDPDFAHAWISIRDGRHREDYALYPDDWTHKDHQRLGKYSDISVNTNVYTSPTASLYADLSPEQEAGLKFWMDRQEHLVHPQYIEDRYNAAHWARDAWEAGTGQRLDVESSIQHPFANDPLSVESAIGLEKSIRDVELRPGQRLKVSPDALDRKALDPPTPEPSIGRSLYDLFRKKDQTSPEWDSDYAFDHEP